MAFNFQKRISSSRQAFRRKKSFGASEKEKHKHESYTDFIKILETGESTPNLTQNYDFQRAVNSTSKQTEPEISTTWHEPEWTLHAFINFAPTNKALRVLGEYPIETIENKIEYEAIKLALEHRKSLRKSHRTVATRSSSQQMPRQMPSLKELKISKITLSSLSENINDRKNVYLCLVIYDYEVYLCNIVEENSKHDVEFLPNLELTKMSVDFQVHIRFYQMSFHKTISKAEDIFSIFELIAWTTVDMNMNTVRSGHLNDFYRISPNFRDMKVSLE